MVIHRDAGRVATMVYGSLYRAKGKNKIFRFSIFDFRFSIFDLRIKYDSFPPNILQAVKKQVALDAKDITEFRSLFSQAPIL